MTVRRGITWGAPWIVCGAVFAQGAAKPDAAAAEAAAAMERAQRQAANPMRIILEASKARPAKPAAEPAPVVAGIAATARGEAGGVTPKSLPTPESPGAGEPRLHAESLQRQAGAAAVPALAMAGSAPAVLSALAMPAPALPAAAAAPIKPKLVDMVAPAIPPRVLDDLGPIGEVSVDLTIRADGSVAAVAMVPPAPRQIQRYVVLALEQWRFEPLPSERQHRVQLVFNGER